MTQNTINSTSRLMQFVSTSSAAVLNGSTQLPADNTIPQNTEGTEILTLSITPTTSTSTLVITFTCVGVVDGVGTATGGIALFQDTTANALTAIYIRTIRNNIIKYVMTSGTTSSTTFKIRSGPTAAAGNYFINSNSSGTREMGGVSRAWLTIEEYV